MITHTHTHTHGCIYIYIYIYKQVSLKTMKHSLSFFVLVFKNPCYFSSVEM